MGWGDTMWDGGPNSSNGGLLANMVGMPIELEIDNHPDMPEYIVWFYEKKTPVKAPTNPNIYKLKATPQLLNNLSTYLLHMTWA